MPETTFRGRPVWIFQGIFRAFPKVQSGDGHSEGAEGGLSTFGGAGGVSKEAAGVSLAEENVEIQLVSADFS